MRQLVKTVLNCTLTAWLILVGGRAAFADSQPTMPQKSAVISSVDRMPLAFTANKGQWPDSILYRANTGGATMWLVHDGIYYQFSKHIETLATTVAVNSSTTVSSSTRFSGALGSSDSIVTALVKAEFVGASPKAEIVPGNELSSKCNYFIGSDRTKWRTDVPNYASVTIKGLYPGIDLSYRGGERGLAIELAAKDSTKLSQLQIVYHGARSVSRHADGITILETDVGQETFNGIVPGGTYQVVKADTGPARLLPSAVSLIYSTFLGGSDWDRANGIAVDSLGFAYVTGYTTSTDFPTVDAFDASFGPNQDAFVSKIAPDGRTLIYSTYVGGTVQDYAEGIAIDKGGNVYIEGWTSSDDFPTSNAYDNTLGGAGLGDAFVTKLSPGGNALIYSTFLGGSNSDHARAIAVDASGNAYVAGWTYSTDFPTSNAYKNTLSGDQTDDAFVTKFAPGGNTLVYSTYLGGSYYDEASAIATDETGSAYVSGGTWSSDFPTNNAYDNSYGGNLREDAFVTKLAPGGNTIIYGTYLGGTYDDVAYGIALDKGGDAYVAGRTTSADFPTLSAYDNTLSAGSGDAFVTKIAPAGNTLVYSTYLGGSNEDFACAIVVDSAGSAFAVGWTLSSDFPTRSAYDNSFGGGFGSDGIVTKISSEGNALIYGTYLGGSGNDMAYGVALDGAENIYVAGQASSPDFPTMNAYDNTLGGSYDAFVTKFAALTSCCADLTGNVDCDAGDHVDISDLSALIDNLYISFTPLCCPAEANIDGLPGIDISDLSALIDYLYISFNSPAVCSSTL